MFDFLPFFAVLVSFIATFVSGFFVIPYLKKLKFGQTILKEGPKWHEGKSGTPTMGGIMIFIGLVAGIVLSLILAFVTSGNLKFEFKDTTRTAHWIAAFGLAVGMGAIGFVDDFIKVVKKRNLGLTARQKTFAQLLVSAVYLIVLLFSGMQTTYIPFVGNVSVVSGAGLIFWPVALFFIYGFTNAVNLTDGIDGLASSVTLVVSCAFIIIAGYNSSFLGANMLAAAAAGACGGFLLWNAHPAKVFMGDTGSMLLGGLVVGLSFAVGKPILLILVGIIYLIEAFSVMLQVAYFKKTKKRIFKMTPIHHHFEMCNWSEEKIVLVFSIVTFIGALLAILPVVLYW